MWKNSLSESVLYQQEMLRNLDQVFTCHRVLVSIRVLQVANPGFSKSGSNVYMRNTPNTWWWYSDRPSAGSSRLSGRSPQGRGSALRPDASCAAIGRVWCPWQPECSPECPETLWTAAGTSEQPEQEEKKDLNQFVLKEQHPPPLFEA